jgi:hypothetical protein
MQRAIQISGVRLQSTKLGMIGVNDLPRLGVGVASLVAVDRLAALKSDADGRAVVAKMKEMPTDDPLFGKGYVRADGRKAA